MRILREQIACYLLLASQWHAFVAVAANDSTAVKTVADHRAIEHVLAVSQNESVRLESTEKAALLTTARRLAMRADSEVDAVVDEAMQRDVTSWMLRLIAHNSDDPGDLPFLRTFFDHVEAAIMGESPDRYVAAILRTPGIENEEKRRFLITIAVAAMDAFATLAHRQSLDEVAVPILITYFDSADDDLAGGAATAMRELDSLTLVKQLETRLKDAEAKFPRGPWDESLLSPTGHFDKNLKKAIYCVSALVEIKSDGALAAAKAALLRWQQMYGGHPQRKEIFVRLNIDGFRDELRRTSWEVFVKEQNSRKSGAEDISASNSAIGTPSQHRLKYGVKVSDGGSIAWLLGGSLALVLLIVLSVYLSKPRR